jgi:serine/threonine protein kinase
LGYSKDESHYYIIFELCDEGNLLDFVKKNSVCDVSKLNILIQICEGMSYLFKNNISHRDLKSTNILVEKYYNNIKIADLGESIFKDKNNLEITGTITHIAPEVLNMEWSPNSDVYSFGGIIFEMIFHDHPWVFDLEEVNEEDYMSTLNLLIRNKSPSFSYSKSKLNNYGLVKPLEKICLDCWNLDISKRPTFEELKIELQSIQKKIMDNNSIYV